MVVAFLYTRALDFLEEGDGNFIIWTCPFAWMSLHYVIWTSPFAWMSLHGAYVYDDPYPTWFSTLVRGPSIQLLLLFKCGPMMGAWYILKRGAESNNPTMLAGYMTGRSMPSNLRLKQSIY